MQQLFTLVFYQPIFNLLIWLYNIIPFKDLGLVIIVLTAIIRLILYPLNSKTIRSQRAM